MSPGRGVAVALALALCAGAPAAGEEDGEPPVLRVLTLNVWHGLRTEGRWRFPGEEPERAERRFAWQLDQVRALDPDLLLLQEVNPNPRRSRRWAAALGFDELHLVTSCGIHLGPLLKIPRNMNEGLTILARPGLGLERVGVATLSGRDRCWGDHLGLQTSETRQALLAAITLGGRRLLLADTHLHNPPFVAPGFAARLDELVAAGRLAAVEREAILALLEAHRARTLAEAERLAGAIAGRLEEPGSSWAGVILGGDLNARPGSPPVAALERAGLRDAVARLHPGEELATYDPVVNVANHRIGAKADPGLPSFGVPEVEELLEARATVARRIDYLLTGGGLAARSARIVLDRAREDLYASDHFGILVEVELE